MRADNLEGPWSQPFFVAPAYTRTFSTQSGFSWRIDGTKQTTYLYMADQVRLVINGFLEISMQIINGPALTVGFAFNLGEQERLASHRD